MTSKTRTTAAEAATETDPASMATAVASNAAAMGRQQLAGLADATSTLLRASEGLQLAQQHLVQRAALVQQQAAERLRKATGPTDLWAIQTEMMMLGVTETAQFMAEVATATVKMQSEMIRPGTATPAVVAANPAASMLQAWQGMFSVPLNGSSAAHAH